MRDRLERVHTKPEDEVAPAEPIRIASVDEAQPKKRDACLAALSPEERAMPEEMERFRRE
ncbi:hypothetical protein EON77_21965 [bacterium]|nr:MAG: hypothetical protein EON77_21965 [bacterium]